MALKVIYKFAWTTLTMADEIWLSEERQGLLTSFKALELKFDLKVALQAQTFASKDLPR